MSEKQRYRGPDIVEVGDVEAVTTAGSSPVRDNPEETTPDWQDYGNLPSPHPKKKEDEEAPASEPAPETPAE